MKKEDLMRLTALGAALIVVAGLVLAAGCGCQRDEPADETRETTSGSKTGAIVNHLATGQALSDWSLVEPAKRYVGDELYDPINGAADKYFPFGFKEASFAFFKKGEAVVQVQIYLMGSPDDASGIFSIYDDVNAREYPLTKTRHTIVWEGGMQLEKGPYFVRVLAQRADLPPVDRGALARFAREVTQRIPEDWHTPSVLGLLPEGYVPGTVKYFRTAATLDDIFYMDGDNVLGLSAQTFGVSACYGTQTSAAGTKVGTDALFVITYAANEDAERAFAATIKHCGGAQYSMYGVPEGPGAQLTIVKGDADFLRIARHGNRVYGAWMIEDSARVNELFNELGQRIRRPSADGEGL